MPCRIGITTNEAQRKAYWENKVVGLQNWKILRFCDTKEEAQHQENRLSIIYGCEALHGGEDSPGP